MKINRILPLEHNFTEVLNSIALKPKILYFYGKMPENVVGKQGVERPKTVAIVGARKHTAYGEEMAYKLAYELARAGVVIVSGLALGIDSVAHRGALEAGGVTVAVLGTAIDQIYPRQHQRLATKIVAQGGCVMSEYPMGTRFFKQHFLERNRLIAGLADIVIVVEANERSGSLNTATHALEQGRELFAVPGDVTRPLSMGCNRLIQQGAYPCLGTEDILTTLFPLARKKRKQVMLFGDNAEETAVLEALQRGERDGENILTIVAQNLPNFDVAKFNQTITMLEIKGMVRGLGANQWVLA